MKNMTQNKCCCLTDKHPQTTTQRLLVSVRGVKEKKLSKDYYFHTSSSNYYSLRFNLM